MKVKLRMVVLPYMPEFKVMFASAKTKFPGVTLTYIGTDKNGKHYFQEFGNPIPFIL
jgi:hypothetical protein